MSQEIRILLSAYACEPGVGSEPGTGWNVAMALSEQHEVTVITRSNNQPKIDAVLLSHNGRRPSFLYYDLPAVFRYLKKKKLIPTHAYYAIWQRGIRAKFRDSLGSYNIFHHITFNSFEIIPGLLNDFSGFKVFGPIGGGQTTNPDFLPTFPLLKRIKERLRNRRVQASVRHVLRRKSLLSCDLVLFANRETQEWFDHSRPTFSEQMIDVGVNPSRFAPAKKKGDGHQVFSASNFESRKGMRLLLLAFQNAHRVDSNLRLRIAGDGPDRAREEAWIIANNLSGVVEFIGRRDHSEMTEEFAKADIFVFPSVRDTSGAIVLEAMACGLPVVCLDHQGAALMVNESCGIRVKPGGLNETISALADSILRLSKDENLRRSMGANGRDRILTEFSWEKKARMLSKYYQILMGKAD